MRMAVAGGTGLIGRQVVSLLEQAGHEPVVLARSRGVDITTGAGLDAALAGAQAVIDVSNVTTLSKKRSVRFFTAGTSRLLEAGVRAGVTHHIALS
ncbi:MAG TPA: NAD-dependent epimerase/dehydratase family protein, partial [Jatrophihabitans sp.]|nr:NAD-dependent epimerase/dehydratase family protein [Jatrophihabitans sp.]